MTTRDPLVLGINAAYHETCAALVGCDGVRFAVEEERLTRVRHGKAARVDNPDALPWAAIDACLAHAGASLADVAAVAYSLAPGLRQATVGRDPYPVDAQAGWGTAAGEAEFDRRVRAIPALLARRAGASDFARRVRFVPHHLAHAASAIHGAPFDEAAVLVLDGIGERSAGWLGRATADALEPLEEVEYPCSLGLLWERFAVWLGFEAADAGKVMGLAAWGDAFGAAAASVERVLAVPDADGGAPGGPPPYVVDAARARLRAADVAGLEALLGPRRRPDEDPVGARFADAAAALQRQTEAAVLATARRLARATGLGALAYAGGVALNCVANARLEREGPFAALHVPPAPHDAGTAVGAALVAARDLLGAPVPRERAGAFVGPDVDEAAAGLAFAAAGLTPERVADPAGVAADLLAAGSLVGWVQGRLELGPRALGNRSLLADPRRREARERLNRLVKRREPFRPFAASVLAEDAPAWLELPARQPGTAASRAVMALAYPVRVERRARVPAVVHEDGTCRVQVVDGALQPRFAALLAAFRARTGVPLVLNTSFNDREPIVCSPADAVGTFLRAGIDALVVGRLVVRR